MNRVDVLASADGSTIFLVTVSLLIVVAYGVRTMFLGRQPDPRVVRQGGSWLLGLWFMEAFYWAFKELGRLFVWLKVKPDTLTWTSLVICLLSAPAAAYGHFTRCGALLAVGTVFDSLDGFVARTRGIGSDRGEMLDAVVDRYADGAPLLGLVVFYRFSVWQMLIPFAALIGSFMLSYVRAKAEALDLDLPSGLMRRHERIVYIVAALSIGPELSPLFGHQYGAVHPMTLAVIAFVALFSNHAALHLLAAARRELQRVGRGAKKATT